MAQIKKGFIAANAIDGSKLQLLNNEAIRAANADGSDVELMKLDGSNVLQFLKMPQVSADPSDGNDVARKSYVDTAVETAKGTVEAALAAEQTAREAAVSAEQSAREQADSTLQGNIDSEASARESGDASLQSQINDILSNVDPAALDSLSEIVGAFQAADNDLQAAITSVLGTHTSELATEVADRTAADADLQSQINSLSSGSSSALDAETAAREAADAAEQAAREAADSAETTARESADSTLQSNIDNETSARQNADSALQTAIDNLDISELASVNITNAQDGDLWQFDLESGKWVNVAPLSAASVATVGGGNVASTSYSVTQIVDANGLPYSLGGKMAFRLDMSGPSTITSVDVKMYSVSGTITSPIIARLYENNGSNLPGTYLGVSSLSITNLPAWPGTSVAQSDGYLSIPFSNVTSTGSNVWISFEYETMPTSGGLFVLATSQNPSGEGGFTYGLTNNYQADDFGNYSNQSLRLVGVVNTTVAGSSSTSAAIGVVKTNSSGLVDDSFVSSAIARVSDMEAADSAEQTARENADSNLQSQIDSLSSSSSAAVAAEQAAREAADADLQSQVDAEKERIDAILSASDADKDSFAEIVALINSVDTENDSAFASYVLSNDAALAQESADRAAGDAGLASDIADETAARVAADEVLTNAVAAEADARAAELAQEVSDRQAADTSLAADIVSETTRAQSAEGVLDSKIDQEIFDRSEAVSAEQAAREAADAVLQSNIDAEQAARESADSALDVRLDILEAVSEGRAKFVVTSTDITNGYLDLAHLAKTDSTFMFFGPLYLHEGDDYSVSTVDGVSRLTWTGQLVTEGSSPTVGDVIYVRYKK